jgi:hypothetical protein
MNTRFRFLFGLCGVAALAAACSASRGNQFNVGGSGSGTGGDGSNGTGATDTGINISSGSGGSTTGTVVCNHTPDQDGDGDGWTGAEGDCNDCDPNVNPGAVDTATTADGGMAMADNDCSGSFNPPEPCDQTIAIDSADPMDGAKSVDLCQQAPANPATKKDKKWGVLSAKWVLPDGTDPQTQAVDMTNYHLGHGMLHAFGPNVHVQAGARMLGLSSGTARGPNDPGYQDVGGFDKNYTSGSPAGFPKESPACPGTITGQPYDGAALEVTIRTPTNATGFTFDFNFFTYEWPNYVCSQYNDFFVALLTPKPANQNDGNISFDKQGNPVSVNNAFVEVCGCPGSGPPCYAGGKTFSCSLGDSTLMGTGFGPDTGFEDHASTSWLVTKAPVKGGDTITLRWTVYDSGDGVLDTTTLIDNWQWIANGGSVSVGTDPIGTPK